jgi:hypothetical protein
MAKKDFADVTKLRMGWGQWRDYLELSRWLQCSHKEMREAETSDREENVTAEAEVGVIWP